MKKITTVFFAALISITLFACGSNNSSDVEIDPSALADALLQTVTSDTLSQTASSLIPSIYSIDENDITSAIVYASTGATACEIAVIECKESGDTSDIADKLQTHVDSQEELYSTYNQSEAARLKTAIIKTAGNYAVLCVSDDTDEAETILKEYGF